MKRLSLLVLTALVALPHSRGAAVAAKASGTNAAPFVDDFTQSHGTWAIETDADTTSSWDQAQGLFLYENKDKDPEGFISVGKSVAIDDKRDFELSFSARFVSGKPSALYGIRWGYRSEPRNYYRFELSADGHVWIARHMPDRSIDVIAERVIPGWVQDDRIHRAVARKLGQEWFFLIDDHVIGQAPFTPLAGGGFRLSVQSGVVVGYRSFAVQYLDQPAAARMQLAADHRREWDALRAVHPEFTELIWDEFVDNRFGWSDAHETDSSLGKIGNGVFHYENLSLDKDTVQSVTEARQLDPDRDFEAEVKLRFVDGPSNRAFGLSWGRNVKSRARREVQIFNDGTYNIWRFDGTKWNTTTEGTKSSYLQPNADNIVTVRRIHRRAYYFFNGHCVEADEAEVLDGREFGFMVQAGAVVDADYFHLRYLDHEGVLPETVAHYESDARQAKMEAGPARTEFVETFTDNHNGWSHIETGKNYASRIENGLLTWENHTQENSQLTFIEHAINGYADYEITLRAHGLGADNKSLIGVRWGRSPDNANYMEFGFAPSSFYRYSYNENGTERRPNEWVPTTFVKPKEDNELKVRKIGENLYFFVNGSIVMDHPARPVAGDYLGLEIGEAGAAAFDELRIRYPEANPEELKKEEAGYRAALLRDHGNPKTGVIMWSEKLRKIQVAADAAFYQHATMDAQAEKDHAKFMTTFNAKALGNVIAIYGQPAHVNSSGLAYYWNYRLIGRTQYYYFVIVNKVGNNPAKWSINNLGIIDSMIP